MVRPERLQSLIEDYQNKNGEMPDVCRMGMDNYIEFWHEAGKDMETWMFSVDEDESTGHIFFHGVRLILEPRAYNDIRLGVDNEK